MLYRIWPIWVCRMHHIMIIVYAHYLIISILIPTRILNKHKTVIYYINND